MTNDLTTRAIVALCLRADELEAELRALQQQESPDPSSVAALNAALAELRAAVVRLRVTMPYEEMLPS